MHGKHMQTHMHLHAYACMHIPSRDRHIIKVKLPDWRGGVNLSDSEKLPKRMRPRPTMHTFVSMHVCNKLVSTVTCR